MKAELRHIGHRRSPVVVIDAVTGDPRPIIEIAADLAPFPPADRHYPGSRRPLTAQDKAAQAYVARLLGVIAPIVSGAFHVDRFDLLDASFSIVTTAADTLSREQRMPHYDSTDPAYLAVLHYLRETPGTAFFRQRSTGIEVIDAGNASRFGAAARTDPSNQGYIAGSTEAFEEIAAVAGVADRLVVYRGNLLHSGIIPPGLPLGDDPRHGRLTTNIFLLGR